MKIIFQKYGSIQIIMNYFKQALFRLTNVTKGIEF